LQFTALVFSSRSPFLIRLVLFVDGSLFKKAEALLSGSATSEQCVEFLFLLRTPPFREKNQRATPLTMPNLFPDDPSGFFFPPVFQPALFQDFQWIGRASSHNQRSVPGRSLPPPSHRPFLLSPAYALDFFVVSYTVRLSPLSPASTPFRCTPTSRGDGAL